MLDITESNKVDQGQGIMDGGNIGKRLMEDMTHNSWLGE